MSLNKIGIIFFHLIIASMFGLFIGWASSIDSPLSTFTFLAGVFMGVMFYLVFVAVMLMLFDLWSEEEEEEEYYERME